MHRFSYRSRSLDDTQCLGAALAGALPPGAVVALNGPLGAGKTALVQVVAAAAGVERQNVTSPTFVLVNEYQGRRRPLYHFDAYRVRDDDEFLALGPEEYFEGRGLSLIEWAERVERCLPPERLEVRLHVTGGYTRRAVVSAVGPHYESLIESLRH